MIKTVIATEVVFNNFKQSSEAFWEKKYKTKDSSVI